MIKSIVAAILAMAAFSASAIPTVPDDYKSLGSTPDQFWLAKKPGMPNKIGQFYIDFQIVYKPATMQAMDGKTNLKHSFIRVLATCYPFSGRVESDTHFAADGKQIFEDDNALKKYTGSNVKSDSTLAKAVGQVCKTKNSII